MPLPALQFRPKPTRTRASLLAGLALLIGVMEAGCGTWLAPASPLRFRSQTKDGVAKVAAAAIAGVTVCDANGPTLLDASAPVILLVHGQLDTDGTVDKFPLLAAALRVRGHQTLCFHYDSSDRLDLGAGALATTLHTLASYGFTRVVVLGYSIGGLVARRALTETHQRPGSSEPTVDLVTVASPFSGINLASICGKTWAHVLSLGLTAAICLDVTGHKWRDIPPDSAFIQDPGTLRSSVRSHLQIVTEEPSDDRAFGVAEQELSDQDPRVRQVRVRAGHQAVVPLLPSLLRAENGLPRPTSPQSSAP